MSGKIRHIGLILDGNRRFAKRLMKQPWRGHEWGAEKVQKLISWCKELNLKELTLYAFSMQNFNRPKEEFNFLMRIFDKMITQFQEDPRIEENDICIRFIGRIHLFPENLHTKMRCLMDLTKDHKSHYINVALAYGGQEEIIDAVKKIGRQLELGEITSKQIDKQMIERNLYLSSQPDLIIRTGGDRRTSNFLIWQSWYSEWFFLEKMWPEFEKEDLIQVIEEFSQRKRRFGK